MFRGSDAVSFHPPEHLVWIAEGEAIATPELLYSPDRRIAVYFFHEGKCGGPIKIRQVFPLEFVIACGKCDLEVPVPLEIAWGTVEAARKHFAKLNPR